VGSVQAQLANPDLKWEERKIQNYGIDASLLEGKVSVTVEAYNSLAEDNLVRLPVAWYLGNVGGEPFVNAASIRNSGVEISATYRQMKSDFKWDVSANFTTIKNRVEDVGNRGKGIDYLQIGNTRTQVGRSLGEYFLIRTDGIFQSEEEILNYTNADGKVIQPFAKPGDIKFVDLDGNGEINNEDRDFVGSPWPTLQSGLQFNASYKQLSLNLQLVGVFGYKIYNDTRRVMDSYQRTNFRSDIDPWSPTNTDGADPRLALDTEQGVIDNNRGNSDRWLDDGGFVRMRNIEIGYALNQPVFTRAGIRNARLFVSSQNLFTITKYKGLDPEIGGNGILERSVDSGNWPASRVFSLGLQLEF
jgi:hypothetical protein